MIQSKHEPSVGSAKVSFHIILLVVTTILAISANKNKNVVTLLVDGVQSPEPGVGSAKVSAADTNDPLYIGGIPGKQTKIDLC